VSIRLCSIYVPAGFRGAERPLFDGLEIEIGTGARVAVLGAAKSGKTTLLRLICGTMRADGGGVERDVRTSWPIPLISFLSSSINVAQNIRFIARLYGIADDDFPRQIATLVGIEAFLNLPLQKCPKFVKPRLALALGIGLEFDTYLFDGQLAPADKPFKEKAAEVVTARMAGHGYVLATSVPDEADKHCDTVYVLESGRAKYFTDKQQGIEYFKELLAAEKQKQAGEKNEKRTEEEDEDAEVIGDIDVIGSAIADEL
jgi:capsular polysaccharide transport system ATP-binding protein